MTKVQEGFCPHKPVAGAPPCSLHHPLMSWGAHLHGHCCMYVLCSSYFLVNRAHHLEPHSQTRSKPERCSGKGHGHTGTVTEPAFSTLGAVPSDCCWVKE